MNATQVTRLDNQLRQMNVLLGRIHMQLQDMEHQQAKILIGHAALAMAGPKGLKAATEVDISYHFRCPWCWAGFDKRGELTMHAKSAHTPEGLV